MKKTKNPKYNRVLIKLSGEVLGGEQGAGICPEAVHGLADQIVAIHKLGVEVLVVIGGGNIFAVFRVAKKELNG
jgi:uridylate kinase